LIVEKQPSAPLLGHPSNGAFQVIDAGTGANRGKVLIFKQRAEKAGFTFVLQRPFCRRDDHPRETVHSAISQPADFAML
jgi:hypothetical protein